MAAANKMVITLDPKAVNLLERIAKSLEKNERPRITHITNQSAEQHTDQTLYIVHDALERSGLTRDQAQEAIREMQNAGILFRERG